MQTCKSFMTLLRNLTFSIANWCIIKIYRPCQQAFIRPIAIRGKNARAPRMVHRKVMGQVLHANSR
uniref:Uncharacterized protein n=1 Tax=Rhizophora mucronata TaxID=61149 RepID=A0A2P2NPE0_RHIMU